MITQFLNSRVTHIFSGTPSKRVSVSDLLCTQFNMTITEANKHINSTGFEELALDHSMTVNSATISLLKKIKADYKDVFEDLDAVITVTQTSTTIMPGFSTDVLRELQLSDKTFTINIVDGCNGFIRGLDASCRFIAQGSIRKILLICGDFNSQIIDEDNLATRCLFGDGVSVAIISDTESNIQTCIRNDYNNADSIKCDNFPVDSDKFLHMDGFRVFSFAISKVPQLICGYLESQRIKIDKFSLIALHQANRLIVETIGKKIGVTEPGNLFNASRFGNTGSASIPLFITTANNEYKNNGDSLAIGFGTGLSWGLARFTIPEPSNMAHYYLDPSL